MNWSMAVNKAKYQIKQHTPEILMVAGAISFVGTCIFVGKGTIKASTIIKEHKEKVDDINTVNDIHNAPAEKTTEELADEFNMDEETVERCREIEYTEKEHKSDIAKVYVSTGIELLRAYAPAIGLGALSLGCFTGSWKILNKRNAAITAAYATLDQGYKNTKERLVEEFGAEKAFQILNGIKEVQVEETEVNEKGKEKTVIRNRMVVDDPKKLSPYAEFWCETLASGKENIYWKKNNVMNLEYLTQKQEFCNELLKAKGYLYLRDVLEILGLEVTPDSIVVGWIYDKENPNIDSYIDFNLPTIYNAKGEECILIDFNVDGNIHQLMSKSDYWKHF